MRSDEQLAEILYGRGKRPEVKRPPADQEPVEPEDIPDEPEAEEEPDEDVEEECQETEDRKGLRPVAKDGLGLIADDDRLMKFLEDDIEVMEAEREKEDRRIEENWRKKT